MKLKTIGKVVGGGAFAAVTWFTAGEFASPDEPDSGFKMDSTFVYMLDSARTIAGVPFTINSGYRSEHHNYLVGGRRGIGTYERTCGRYKGAKQQGAQKDIRGVAVCRF